MVHFLFFLLLPSIAGIIINNKAGENISAGHTQII
jgi:hypothetical protein